jgi:hypothetical protein
MAKRTGWRNAITALITEICRRPFKFGVHDCAVGWAFPAIEKQVGLDMGAPLRDRYNSIPECARVLNSLGHASLAAYLAAHFDEVPVLAAQYGDIAVLPCEHEGWALGVFFRDHIGVITPAGYGTTLRTNAQRAFRIA